MTDVDTTLAGGSWVSRAFYQLARGVCVGFCRVWFRMTVEGLEHVPRSGPFVLAPVHRSNMDTPDRLRRHPSAPALHGQGLAVEEVLPPLVPRPRWAASR